MTLQLLFKKILKLQKDFHPNINYPGVQSIFFKFVQLILSPQIWSSTKQKETAIIKIAKSVLL